MAGTFVYTGPSLNPTEAAQLLAATILPPIRRGDLRQIEHCNPDAIAIIDGEFYQSLAVSPKEILPLLEKGVRVLGASSMGALRAVELEKYGMEGIGRVFRLFRSGLLNSDDEVALTYCPFSYAGKSEPLVNTRFALRAAVRASLLSRREAREIVVQVKAHYFPDRTRELLLTVARREIGVDRANVLNHFLTGLQSDIKNEDARLLLSKLRDNGKLPAAHAS